MMTPSLPAAPRLVLFDLDDTLCDFTSARKSRLEIAFRLAFETAGVRLDADISALVAESIAMSPFGNEHFGELLGRYGVEDRRAVARARDWYVTNRFHTLALFADAVMTVDTVRAFPEVERIGLVTNGPSDIQRCKIDLLGIEPHVDFIIVSEEFGHWKPEPEIFLEALRIGGAAPDETVFIGDSAENDIAGAQASGIAGIWINPDRRDWELPSPAPARSVASLAGVRALFARLP